MPKRMLLALMFALAALPGLGQPPYRGVDPVSVAIGDFDGDGKADVAYACSSSCRIGLLPGKGDGTFSSPQTLALGQAGIDHLAPFPLPNGKIGLMALEGDQVKVITPGGAKAYPGGTSLPRFLAVADMDRDGVPDAVVLGSREVVLLPGRADGSLGAPHRVPLPLEAGMNLAVGDVNGDGFPDIAVPFTGNSKVFLILGRARWGFESRKVDLGGPVGYVGLGDFNGDGKTDLAGAGMNRLRSVAGGGNGSFGSPQALALTEKAICQFVAVGDFNRDGLADVVTGDAWTSLTVALGDRKALLTRPRAWDGGQSAWGVAVGDLNGDGAPDIAVANVRTSLVTVLLNQGEGSFKGRSYNVDPNRVK